MAERISFQGELGAYSHAAVLQARPDAQVIPCATFEDAIDKCRTGEADFAMLPVENSTYGRVADIHALLPDSGLKIIDETFLRVQVALMALPGVTLSEITHAMSHTVLLGQVRGFLRDHSIAPVTGADTAGSAKIVAEKGVRTTAALASELAGQIYGLETLARGIEDQSNNTTRFLLMSRQADHARRGTKMVTTFTFRVRNIPAALYKALGGFATNGVNMTKLESYMVGGSFVATEFYADIEGHPEDANVKLALEELAYFTTNINVLGVYPRTKA